MVRVKGGKASHKRHRKILDKAKGYWMSRSKQFKKAQEAVLHAGEYAFAGRKMKKRHFRTLWIVRLNAAVKQFGMSYRNFIHALKINNIALDRKILSKMAIEYPVAFEKLVNQVKK